MFLPEEQNAFVKFVGTHCPENGAWFVLRESNAFVSMEDLVEQDIKLMEAP